MARILMVVRPSEGGAFGHVARLGSELVGRGHEVGVCGPHASEDLGAVSDRGLEMIFVEMVQPIAPQADLRGVRELGAVYRRWRPDLIHAHGSKAATLARLARAARPQTPVVFTPHQYAFANYFSRRAERAAYELIERAMAPLATCVLCVCEAERQLAVRIGSGARARVVHNGIDFTPATGTDSRILALRERGPVICAVAELHPRKGLLSLLDALPRVLAASPSATLAIAGEGGHREALVRHVAELGIAPSVRLLGQTSDVPSVLAGADVFVNSAWAEAFPYSVLEAMAAGIPTVATDVGGTGEAIVDGDTGRLVPPRDPDALADGILGLLDDPVRAGELASRAGERMRERFTFDRMVDGTLDVYAELGVR